MIDESIPAKAGIHIYQNQLIKRATYESLILAQDERWRRALYMQVERRRKSERRTGE